MLFTYAVGYLNDKKRGINKISEVISSGYIARRRSVHTIHTMLQILLKTGNQRCNIKKSFLSSIRHTHAQYEDPAQNPFVQQLAYTARGEQALKTWFFFHFTLPYCCLHLFSTLLMPFARSTRYRRIYKIYVRKLLRRNSKHFSVVC